ncbi:MAG TPA: PIN domain-containing protein [Thermoanaerobaculia bacterium]|jgi:predicted nucleic acid-binding protein
MIAVDSSVIIAGVLSWHEFHERAIRALEKAVAGRRLLMALPVLIESYSVLTRLPAPHRLRPAVAYELLHDSFAGARAISLSPTTAWTFLQNCVDTGTVGGRVYDAVIASAAIDAGASELLTFNARDFDVFRDRIAIVVP